MPSIRDQLIPIIQQAAASYQVPVALLYRLLSFESGDFDEEVAYGRRLGGSGEIGLGQFMPATAAGLSRQWGQPFNPADPIEAIWAAARHLSELSRHFNGNWEMAVAAYNAGQPAIDEAIKKSQQSGANPLGLPSLNLPFGIGNPAANPITQALFGESWQAFIPESTRTLYLPAVYGQGAEGPPSLSEFRAGVGAELQPSLAPASDVPLDEQGLPVLSYNDFLQRAGGDHFIALQDWTAYQQARRYGQENRINDALSWIEAVSNELSADVESRRLSLDQATQEFSRRLDALEYGTNTVRDLAPYTIPRTGTGALFGFGPGEIGSRLGLAAPSPSYSFPDPLGLAEGLVRSTPALTSFGTTDLSALSQANRILQEALGYARSSTPPPGRLTPAGPAYRSGPVMDAYNTILNLGRSFLGSLP
jgi:hypothetical protein